MFASKLLRPELLGAHTEEYYLLCTNYMPGSVLGTRPTMKNRKDMISALRELFFYCGNLTCKCIIQRQIVLNSSATELCELGQDFQLRFPQP